MIFVQPSAFLRGQALLCKAPSEVEFWRFRSIRYIFDMAVSAAYLPKYGASRALVIGINKYQSAGPLTERR